MSSQVNNPANAAGGSPSPAPGTGLGNISDNLGGGGGLGDRGNTAAEGMGANKDQFDIRYGDEKIKEAEGK